MSDHQTPIVQPPYPPAGCYPLQLTDGYPAHVDQIAGALVYEWSDRATEFWAKGLSVRDELRLQGNDRAVREIDWLYAEVARLKEGN
jgi:hypothetical protein